MRKVKISKQGYLYSVPLNYEIVCPSMMPETSDDHAACDANCAWFNISQIGTEKWVCCRTNMIGKLEKDERKNAD